MPLNLITAPTVEPVTVDDMKAHIVLPNNDDDDLIFGLITAARVHLENDTRRALVSQTWDYYFDSFPREEFSLPKTPLQSVTSIKYLDSSGTEQTLSSSYYGVDSYSEPGEVFLKYSYVWPTTYYQENAIYVRFVAGYSAVSAIPEPLKLAIKLLVGHWYENRNAANVVNMSEIPMGYEALVSPYRVHSF